jgi:SAM-dependent methyltransferase
MLNFKKNRQRAMANAIFEERYGWDAKNPADDTLLHTQADVESIWDEVVTLIPAGVTKILEIGCGSGGLFHKIRAAFPSVDYLGIDPVPENIEAAQASLSGEPDTLFEIGTAADTLMRTDADWDFVVSVHCLCSETEASFAEAYIGRVNITSAKGFVIVGHKEQLDTGYARRVMSEINSESTNVSGVYYEGARGFLDDSLLKFLHPIYIARDDAGRPLRKPSIPPRDCVLTKGRFNAMLMRTHYADEVQRKGNPAPTDFKGVTITNGRVTARPTLPVDPAKVADIT